MLEGATYFVGGWDGSQVPNLFDSDDDDNGDDEDAFNLILIEVQRSCHTIRSFCMVSELTQAITVYRS
jgi:hypothetical protein